MPYDTDAAGHTRTNPGSVPGRLDDLDRVDRILLGACAALWLAALGAGVAATVSLVELGRGQPRTAEATDTPWLLYTVIGVSAVVIIGAIPLLLRARRTAFTEQQPPAKPTEPPARSGDAPTEKLRIAPTGPAPVPPRRASAVRDAERAGPHAKAVDQVWFRCAVVIGCAMGAGLVAAGVATYLMAVDQQIAAWSVFGVSALVTVGMPAIPWFYLRQLRTLLRGGESA